MVRLVPLINTRRLGKTIGGFTDITHAYGTSAVPKIETPRRGGPHGYKIDPGVKVNAPEPTPRPKTVK